MERNNTIAAKAALDQKERRLELYEGRIEISDPSKAHAVAVKNLVQPPTRWKWKVYLPAGKKYRLRWTDFDIPADGIIKPENNANDRTYGGATEYIGEFLVEFGVYLGYDGKIWMQLAADDQGVMTGDWRFWNESIDEFPLDRKEFPLNYSDRHSLLHKHGTRVFDKDVLLLHAAYPPENDDQSPSGCAAGFAVWLEEIPDQSPDPNGR